MAVMIASTMMAMADPRPSAGTNVTTQSVILNQIRDLGERMDAGFRRTESKLDDLERRIRDGEHFQPVFQSRLEAVERQLSDNCKQTEALEKAVITLNHAISLARWLGLTAGGALILWLVSNILGLL